MLGPVLLPEVVGIGLVVLLLLEVEQLEPLEVLGLLNLLRPHRFEQISVLASVIQGVALCIRQISRTLI
jgi:hypothetical protein